MCMFYLLLLFFFLNILSHCKLNSYFFSLNNFFYWDAQSSRSVDVEQICDAWLLQDVLERNEGAFLKSWWRKSRFIKSLYWGEKTGGNLVLSWFHWVTFDAVQQISEDCAICSRKGVFAEELEKSAVLNKIISDVGLLN